MQSELKTDTRGTAVLNRIFDGYGPYLSALNRKDRGVLVSNCAGNVTSYALRDLEPRGVLFVSPGEATYCGHVIGECSKDDRDLDVNPVKAKKLTNVRASGMDEAIRLSPPRVLSLEDAIVSFFAPLSAPAAAFSRAHLLTPPPVFPQVYCAPDELVEITPSAIRMRKRILDPDERARKTRNFKKEQ